MKISHRNAIGDAHRGRKRSEAEVAAVVAGQRAMSEEAKRFRSERCSLALTGKTHSEETRRKIGAAQKGKPKGPWSDERRANYVNPFKGMKRPKSPETIAKGRATRAANGRPVKEKINAAH